MHAQGGAKIQRRERDDPVGSLARGLAILDTLANTASPLGLGEIAERAGFDASTAHRLLQVLLTKGYVVRDNASKRYLLGPRGCIPLSLHHPITELRREVHGPLTELQERFGGSVALILFLFDERLISEMVRSPDTLSPFYETWLRSPLHASASGKVLLASRSAEERRRLLGAEPYARFTPSTLTSRLELDQELASIDSLGYVVAANDYVAGLTAVGAPICWPDDQTIGCLSSIQRSNLCDAKTIAGIGSALRDDARLFSKASRSIRAVAQLLGR